MDVKQRHIHTHYFHKNQQWHLFHNSFPFLFEGRYHWCLKLIQKAESGWAARGERKQDCTRWDQTDDRKEYCNIPCSFERDILLSPVLATMICVLTASVIFFFKCFEQHTVCLPDNDLLWPCALQYDLFLSGTKVRNNVFGSTNHVTFATERPQSVPNFKQVVLDVWIQLP